MIIALYTQKTWTIYFVYAYLGIAKRHSILNE